MSISPGDLNSGVRDSLCGETAAVRIQQVLAGRGLTLSEVSRKSALRYSRDSAYRIPHNFYAQLRTEGFTPRMEQVLAFSAITNHRLADWLILFGFQLDRLSSFRACLPAKRTVLLDSAVYDDNAGIAWFEDKP